MTNNSSIATVTAAPSVRDSDIWPWRVGLYGVGGLCISCIGLVCNTITVIVLAKFRTKSTAPFLLICLELSDTLFLISEMCLDGVTYLAWGELITDSYRDFIRPIYCKLFPLPSLTRTISAYLIVLITLERYTVVAWPFRAHRIWRPRVARIAVLGIVLVTLLYHIPLYLAYSCSYIPQNSTGTHQLVFHRTTFGESHYYNHIQNTWFNLVVYFLLPFAILLLFNSLLLIALRKSKTPNFAGMKNEKKSKRARYLTVMVVSMTTVYLVCEALLATSLVLTTGINNFLQCSIGCNRFSAVADTFVIFNAAINFAIYCATGKQFRDVFRSTFCMTRATDASTITSTRRGYASSTGSRTKDRERDSHKDLQRSVETFKM